ncbi:hypothetical protein M404DRAFT_995633 [Pisolithus tinctorius Marx 270]|uniref:Uncharacterized protein n=1 Tax=Pisolithus tinctorius Marx 270 TaxID=870435 RepID=A0A0C3PA31_PISTI|nr:hypothetical protein M404DRAFT_995633 [Pisolithus tinctorius Marx 270]
MGAGKTVETVVSGTRLNNVTFSSSSHLTRACQLACHIHWIEAFVATISTMTHTTKEDSMSMIITVITS